MSENKNTIDIKKQIEDVNHRWYTLSVISWQESLVVQNLQERVKKQSLWEDIIDYLVPIVPEIYYRSWKKIYKQRKLYPGYVFIKTKMNDKIWYIIRNTPWVRLIVWAEITPIPLTDKEYNEIIEQIKEKTQRAESVVPFKEWDVVNVKDWEFKWMKWKVTQIDREKWFLFVNIEILWRNTPIMLPFEKIEKIN